MSRIVRQVGVLVCLMSAWHASPEAAAQMVQVRPGYVKAPFVEIVTHPDGSSHVRAPFVSVHSPPPRYVLLEPTDVVPPPPLPFSQSPATAAPHSTSPRIHGQQRLVAAHQDLERQLERIRAGAAWQKYLHLPTDIVDMSGRAIPPPPGTVVAPLSQQVQALRERYEAVRDDPTFQPIAKLPAFQRTLERLVAFQGLIAASPAAAVPTPAEPQPIGPQDARMELLPGPGKTQ